MAKFLVDASLPRDVAYLLRASGHEAVDVRDIGLGSAPDSSIADRARRERECIITRDEGFANILDFPAALFAGIAIIRAPRGTGRAAVLGLVRAFLQNEEVVRGLAGRLTIVEPGRIRTRSG